MHLCLDIGNTHIYGGIFKGDQLAFQFRYPSKGGCSSDELGIFLKSYLHEIKINVAEIKYVSYCSVVPALDYPVRAAFIKYFALEPFVLRAEVNTGLQINYKNPTEVGPDRVANAIAVAQHYFPQKNCIVVDLGSATSFDVISANGIFLGGAIMPGIQMQMRALNEFTANLPPVRIMKSETALGQSTTTNIQAGLYFGQRGAIKEIIEHITTECFSAFPPIVIGTGGFAYLYEDDSLFNAILPELVLHGLRLAHLNNL